MTIPMMKHTCIVDHMDAQKMSVVRQIKLDAKLKRNANKLH